MADLLNPAPKPELTVPELQGRELQTPRPRRACSRSNRAPRSGSVSSLPPRSPTTIPGAPTTTRSLSSRLGPPRVDDLAQVQPIHVAAWVKESSESRSRPTVKQHLAAIRMLFDWLVTGQVIPVNPAHAVRGPKHIVKRGKTAVLGSDEMRDLLDSIPTTSVRDLRDRALLGTMAYSFARIGAVLSLQVEDYYVQKRRSWMRLHEKGGKVNEMPCHHNLEKYLEEHLQAAGIGADRSGPLFRAWRRGKMQGKGLNQSNVHEMTRCRARAAGIPTNIGCHSFWVTGIKSVGL
ncbi:MAG TPA: tyrosine-type recombinase/integrase [Bryobacteraceae bacterium]|nr:tyrosine-type recombinase/integrase [Bryobacteraceae bacterium]